MSKYAYDAMRDALLAVESYLAVDVDGDRPKAKEHWDLVRAALKLTDADETDPKSPIYWRLSATLVALRNCEKGDKTEWVEKHRKHIAKLMRHAPSGGRFDHGTTLDIDKSNERKLVFNTCIHHMNEHGYYDHWTEHTVRVTPDFGGFDLKISGSNRGEIKDLIEDEFDTFLKTESND